MNGMPNGKRIQIRLKRLSDARDDYAWQTDAELAELDAAAPLQMSYQQYLSEYSFDLCYPTSNRREFSVETSDGLHIGNCVYYNINLAERKAELGVMIGNRSYWNKGYGVEIIKAILNYIFTRTNLERVYLTTLEWNLRAQKCFKKCGFEECGQLTREGRDFLLMAIHRESWEKLWIQPDQAAVPAAVKQEIPQTSL